MPTIPKYRTQTVAETLGMAGRPNAFRVIRNDFAEGERIEATNSGARDHRWSRNDVIRLAAIAAVQRQITAKAMSPDGRIALYRGITDADIEDATRGETPVFVMFGASRVLVTDNPANPEHWISPRQLANEAVDEDDDFTPTTEELKGFETVAAIVNLTSLVAIIDRRLSKLDVQDW